MTPARAGFWPLLLLLLGLWVPKVPVSAKPKNKSPAQWFEIQHVQPHPQRCSLAMGSINKDNKHCKKFNTFLRDSFSSVATACKTPAVACKNGKKNCHRSQGPVSLTLCEFTEGKYPSCKYKEKSKKAPYIVACDPPQKNDPWKLQLVPVHFDDVL